MVQTREVGIASVVGDVCEDLVEHVLKKKQNEKALSFVPQLVLTDEKAAGNFELDFLVKRSLDDQLFAVWISHRASAENSDAYLWGLVEESRIVRATYKDVVCVFVIVGNKNGWKDWTFPASLLFFDYFVFIGDSKGRNLMGFKFENAPSLERTAKERFLFRNTTDIDQIVRTLQTQGVELRRETMRDAILTLSDGNKSPLAKYVHDILQAIGECLDISSMTPNEYVRSLYEQVAFLKSGRIQEARAIDVSMYRHGILEFVTYLLMLHNFGETSGIVKTDDLIEVLRSLYMEEARSEIWSKNAVLNLINSGLIIRENASLRMNPEIVIPVAKQFCEKKLSLDVLTKDFVYSILLSKLSSSQAEVLDNLAKKCILADGIDRVKKVLASESSRSAEILLAKIVDHEVILRRRAERLEQFLSELVRVKTIEINDRDVVLQKQPTLDEGLVLFYHNINKRSNILDSYVLHLIKGYRDNIVERSYELFCLSKEKGKLAEDVGRIDGEGVRIFAEVAIFAVDIPVKTLRNIIEEDQTAGTVTFAFLRGDTELPRNMSKRLIDVLERRPIVHKAERVSEEILARRIQQVKRNPRTNVLEERLYTYLKTSNLVFLGCPEEQSDVYLQSVLSSIGLNVGEKGEIKRGEDFIIPTSTGKLIVVACRASPQSYEARRMCGHSLQFCFEWDERKKEWIAHRNILHVAILDGAWSRKWVENMLNSVFDKVFKSDELDELIRFARNEGAIEYTKGDYEELIRYVINEFRRKELNPATLPGEIKKQVLRFGGSSRLTEFLNR